MDPIKNQISAIDPLTIDPVAEPNGEEALHKILSGTTVFSDSRPIASVTSLEQRRRRKAQIAGGLLLGAAAVTAGVLVAANFGSINTAPAPAVTVTSTEATPTPSVSVTPTPTPTPSVTPTATPIVAGPVTLPPVAPTIPAVAPTPVSTTTQPPVPVATSQTFTFPDGHISFTYPVGWSVRPEQGPSAGATILDGTGAEVAFMNSGFYGDGTGGPVTRTVYDRAVVPGLTDTSGNPVEFGFAANQARYVPYGAPADSAPVLDPPSYFMDLRIASELQPGETGSGSNQILMPNGYMSARVIFDINKQPAFATPEAAKAWMGSAQYGQLKSMLMSVSYK